MHISVDLTTTVDVVLADAFGLAGYWLIKHEFEPAPLLLGMVLGPLMEKICAVHF